MKIVIDNAIPYISGVLEPYATVVYRPAAEISHEDAVDADMLIIRTRTRCDRHLLECHCSDTPCSDFLSVFC